MTEYIVVRWMDLIGTSTQRSSPTGRVAGGQPRASDPAAAAEFASWFVGQFLSGRSGVRLIEPSSMRTVEITAGLSGEEILNRLE